MGPLSTPHLPLVSLGGAIRGLGGQGAVVLVKTSSNPSHVTQLCALGQFTQLLYTSVLHLGKGDDDSGTHLRRMLHEFGWIICVGGLVTGNKGSST